MIDSGNFTLNIAKEKMMKTHFIVAENKYASEQFLIEYW